jgi:RES domain
VLYSSSQRLGCFLETLACFRKDLKVIAELRKVAGDDDYTPFGTVPLEWLENRLIGSAVAKGRYADICASASIGYLRTVLATQLLEMELEELDASTLQFTAPRLLTQQISRLMYESKFDGIYYRSKYGHDLDNWAFFEPFKIQSPTSSAIRANDPDFRRALKIHALRLAPRRDKQASP